MRVLSDRKASQESRTEKKVMSRPAGQHRTATQRFKEE